MWYENSVFIAILSFTLIAVLLLILSAIPGYKLDPGTEKVLSMIITGIAAFVTGYATHAIQNAVTTKSTVTKEETSNAEPPKTD